MNKYVITTFCLLSPPVLLLSLFFFLSVLAHPSSCLILQTLVEKKKTYENWQNVTCWPVAASLNKAFFIEMLLLYANANVSLRLFILFLSDISELSVVNGAVILHGFLCWNGCTDAQISSDCILNKPDGSRWKIMSWFVAVLLFSDSHYMC